MSTQMVFIGDKCDNHLSLMDKIEYNYLNYVVEFKYLSFVLLFYYKLYYYKQSRLHIDHHYFAFLLITTFLVNLTDYILGQ